MKKWICILLVALFGIALPAIAADPAKSPTIQGKIKIKYNTRTQTDDAGAPKVGVKDVYTIDMAVTDTLLYQGSVEFLPLIPGTLSAKQPATLAYNLNMLVRNPANLSETRSVGKLVGGVPITAKGVYEYESGTLRTAVESMGKSVGFSSSFKGSAEGRPLGEAGLLERAKKKLQTIKKQVKGKTITLTLTNYDLMTYNSLILAAGPLKSYPDTTVNGQMFYDPERGVWFFNGVTLAYAVEGKNITDKLSGNIRWVEDPQRKTNGLGEYQFDVRFNEPDVKTTESEVFAPAEDEAAFFSTDTSLACMTGTAKYKDTMLRDTVTASDIDISLVGNNLNKQQVVNAFKLIWLVNIVPMNAE